MQPREAVGKAAATVELVSPKPGTVRAFNHLARCRPYDVDVTAADPEARGGGGWTT